MDIDRQKTISDIKREFSELFPGLKIEFFDQPHAKSEGSPAEHQFPDDLKLENISHDEREGQLTITPEMKVAELEKALAEEFGLYAQVYRRSNRLWLQTASTDDWTLEVQNRKGLRSVQ